MNAAKSLPDASHISTSKLASSPLTAESSSAKPLAGIAGVLTAYDMGINPDSGSRTLFVAVVAVILGGLRNLLLGTLIGSVALGILTAYAGFFFPEWVTFGVFVTMILLILVRPQGLFG